MPVLNKDSFLKISWRWTDGLWRQGDLLSGPGRPVWGQDSCPEKQQISLGLVFGLVPASRRAWNARASDAGQRMTSLASQGTEDEHTGCFHGGGELCVHCSPID